MRPMVDVHRGKLNSYVKDEKSYLFSIDSITSPTTFGFLWEMKLSSTHHPIVHCLPFISLFATHGSYRFNLNPIFLSVSVNNLYHNSADFRPHIVPSLALNITRLVRAPFLPHL